MLRHGAARGIASQPRGSPHDGSSNEPPFSPLISKKVGRTRLQIRDKVRRLLFDFCSRVRGQPDRGHVRLGSSELATPYRSRSAFASTVRPSASSASAVTLALSLVQAWSRPRTLSCA